MKPTPYETNPYKAPPKIKGPLRHPSQDHSLGIVALVFGILALTLGCCCWTHIPFGLTAVICGILGLSKARNAGQNDGMALAGLVCGAVALVLYTGWAVFGIIFNFGAGGMQIIRELNQI